jgi:sugar transferase EpsL
MKRVFDVFVSGILLVILSPLMLLLVFLILVNLGYPPFFTQVRPGLRNKPFRMHKLRTMKNSRDSEGKLFSDEQRLTSFGKVLRASSLDELPELWNVLRGEMSLVGPRPLLLEYLDRYTLEQARRHEVRPGITGWAQVNGRNSISWDDKFKLDVWYIDNWSFWLDIKIVIMTVVRVLRQDGISADGEATMPIFVGKPPYEKNGDSE